jgi:sterol desaturase/sphingolipid hydroxylase (fatty acid hydroxylase superfamily)
VLFRSKAGTGLPTVSNYTYTNDALGRRTSMLQTGTAFGGGSLVEYDQVGPPAVAVLIFEVILNGMAMFNHGNFKILEKLDACLRKIIVTPDMHLVHHSIVRQESNHNFGFNISWWDRLFGTYQAEPSAGREGMIIGLTGFLDVRYARFWKMILNPFEKG